MNHLANSRQKIPSKSLSTTSVLTALILLTLPLMQLFTIDAGFPLKIYELALVFWLGFSLIRLRFKIYNWTVLMGGLFFIAYALAVLFLILFIFKNAGTYSYFARISPFGDGLLKTGYFFLCLLGFNLVALAVAEDPQRAVRLWLWGAAFAAVLHLLFFALSFFDLPLPGLPGMAPYPYLQQSMYFLGANIFRAGTFLEGNYAGPFFVLSFLIAVSFRAYRYALLFLVAVAASLSTVAFIGLGCAVLYIVVMDYKKFALYGFAAFVVIAACAPLFNAIFSDKYEASDEGSSVAERMNTVDIGLDMFAEHPLIGVGLSQFGFNTPGWNMWQAMPRLNSEYVAPAKKIPNNVYVEMSAELGVIGLGFFLLFFIPLLRLAMKTPNLQVRAGVITILVFWMASPTFTMMYYWAYLGLACGLASAATAQRPPKQSRA